MPLGAQIRICDSNIGGQRHGGSPGRLNSNTAGAAFSEGVDLGGTKKNMALREQERCILPRCPLLKKLGLNLPHSNSGLPFTGLTRTQLRLSLCPFDQQRQARLSRDQEFKVKNFKVNNPQCWSVYRLSVVISSKLTARPLSVLYTRKRSTYAEWVLMWLVLTRSSCHLHNWQTTDLLGYTSPPHLPPGGWGFWGLVPKKGPCVG